MRRKLAALLLAARSSAQINHVCTPFCLMASRRGSLTAHPAVWWWLAGDGVSVDLKCLAWRPSRAREIQESDGILGGEVPPGRLEPSWRHVVEGSRWRRGRASVTPSTRRLLDAATARRTTQQHTGGKNHQRAPRPGRARRRRADLRALHGQGAARDEGRDERGHLRRERRLRPETGKSQGARRDAAADDDCYWWTLFRAGGADAAWETRRRRRGGAAETPSTRHKTHKKKTRRRTSGTRRSRN